MKVTIDVTQEDINDGEQEAGCSCPVALAARRVLTQVPDLYVASATLLRAMPGPDNVRELTITDLPQEAREFIVSFDSACPSGSSCDDEDCRLDHTVNYGPFSFELDVPDALLAVAK